MTEKPEIFDVAWDYEIQVDSEHIQHDTTGFSDMEDGAASEYYGDSE